MSSATNVAAKASFARLIKISSDRLEVRVRLKPGVTIPSSLLRHELAERGVTHGISEEALTLAETSHDVARRLILAKGTPPQPGTAGCDVCGEAIPALPQVTVPDQVKIQVRDDGLEATITWPLGVPVDREALRKALLAARISHGYHRENLALLLDGQQRSEVVVIAAGQSPKPGSRAGFHMYPQARGRMPALLSQVEPGQIIARWEAGRDGAPGCDIHGREIPPPEIIQPDPELIAGPGTEQKTNQDRPDELVAARNGIVYQRPDGTVLVVEAKVITGDVPDKKTIKSNRVVVVKGNIESGAKMTCTADVIVTGNIHDAHMQIAGNLVCDGKIMPGENYLAVANTLRCHSAAQRIIMAGSAIIDGLAFACMITTTEDLSVHHAIGGRLIAGNSLHLTHAGDAYGNVTDLWAGHGLQTPRLRHLQNLQIAGRIRERELAVEDLQQVQERMAGVQRTLDRINQGAYVNEKEANDIGSRMDGLVKRSDRLDAMIEGMREEIERHRSGDSEGPDPFNLEHNVEVAINGAARRGTSSKLRMIKPCGLITPSTIIVENPKPARFIE